MSAFVTFQIVRRTRFATRRTYLRFGFPFYREVEATERTQEFSTFIAWARYLAFGNSHHVFEVACMRAPPLAKTPNKRLHANSRCSFSFRLAILHLNPCWLSAAVGEPQR